MREIDQDFSRYCDYNRRRYEAENGVYLFGGGIYDHEICKGEHVGAAYAHVTNQLRERRRKWWEGNENIWINKNIVSTKQS